MSNPETASRAAAWLRQVGSMKQREAILAGLEAVSRQGIIHRIWNREPGLWKAEEGHQRIIRNSLGWLDAPSALLNHAEDLILFAEEIRDQGFQQVVLLGMGGSSLCAEVLRATFGSRPGFPELRVLDSTDPDSVGGVERAIVPDRTLFVVASKSGTTTEPLMFFRFFYGLVEESGSSDPGSHFVAITDPGTPLAELARDKGFRRVFLNMPDIGGRFSALSFFGMVPAALMGLDVRELLNRALKMSDACRTVSPEKNPGAALGTVLATLSKMGRDKLTVAFAAPLRTLGLWVEQLIAESTGKEDGGILPVVGEPVGPPEVYGEDRLFVSLSVEDAPDPETEGKLEGLEQAGHPVIRRLVEGPLGLGEEFFIWEFATAVAGAILQINPFDQPNVAESKENTRRLLKTYRSAGSLPEPDRLLVRDDWAFYGDPDLGASIGTGGCTLPGCLAAHLGRVGKGDYVALTAYLPENPQNDQLLGRARNSIRDRLKVATTVGYGPRFLHSTGQFHKGGPATGLFVQITASRGRDLPIPGEEYSFGVLEQAQALGDFEALAGRGRRLLRIEIGSDIEAGLTRLCEALEDVLRAGW